MTNLFFFPLLELEHETLCMLDNCILWHGGFESRLVNDQASGFHALSLERLRKLAELKS